MVLNRAPGGNPFFWTPLSNRLVELCQSASANHPHDLLGNCTSASLSEANDTKGLRGGSTVCNLESEEWSTASLIPMLRLACYVPSSSLITSYYTNRLSMLKSMCLLEGAANNMAIPITCLFRPNHGEVMDKQHATSYTHLGCATDR